MRRLILLPVIAAALLVGCDGGLFGFGKIENFGFINCHYRGGVKDTFAHGKGAVYCFIKGQGLVRMFESEFCYGEYKPCARSGTYTGREYAAADGRWRVIYDGEWKNGRYHGQGISYSPDGRIFYQGEFSNGYRHGQGTWYRPDGSIQFRGESQDGQYWTGLGTRYYKHGGISHEGSWKAGKYHGQGTTYYSDGRIAYKGEYCNGEEGPCK